MLFHGVKVIDLKENQIFAEVNKSLPELAMFMSVLAGGKNTFKSIILNLALDSANLALCDYFRVRMGPGKPGKSWNFIMAFSRTGKSWEKATGPGKFWKSSV